MLLCDEPRFTRLHKYAATCHDIIEHRTPVIIFGAKTAGVRVLHELQMSDVPIVSFIDNTLKNSAVENTTVKSPCEYSHTDIPVVAAAPRFHNQILLQASELDIKTIIPYLAFLHVEQMEDEFELKYFYDLSIYMENEKDYFDGNKQREVFGFGSLDFVITEKCSLRCRDCANLMQYFSKPNSAIYEEVTLAFDRLCKAMGSVSSVNILGGEPLIEPKYIEYVNFIKKYNVGQITIHTNGTVIPDEKMIAAMKDPRVMVNVADYGLKNQKSKQVTDILEKNSIKNFYFFTKKWQNCAEIKLHNKSLQELSIQMKNCCVSCSSSLKNGKLWRCPFAGNAAALGAIPTKDWDFVDLTDESIPLDVLRLQIKELMSLPLIKACDYCNGRPVTGGIQISAAIQIKDVRTF